MGILDGKVAVITAGTRSIGREIAETYLREGASVVVNSRSAEKGRIAVEEMSALGPVHYIQGDATKQADVEAVIAGTVEKFGRLDIVVLNAGGVNRTGPVSMISDEEWQHELNLNLNHTFWGMRKALEYLVPQGSGRIISLASVEGKLGKPGIPGYVANKHAIVGLTKSLAHEVGTLGITVNCICPGIVLTDMFYESGPETIKIMGLPNLDALAEIFYKESALKRPITVAEVAAGALFLASDAASGITGVALNIDGGTSPY